MLPFQSPVHVNFHFRNLVNIRLPYFRVHPIQASDLTASLASFLQYSLHSFAIMLPFRPIRSISRKIKSSQVIILISVLLTLVTFRFSLEFATPSTNAVPLELYQGKGYGPFTLRFYSKLATLTDLGTQGLLGELDAIKSIDELFFNDKLEPLTITANPLDVISNRYPNGDQYNDLSLEEKASLYVNEVIPKCEYHFQPVDQQFFAEDNTPEKLMGKRMEKWSELSSVFTEEKLIKLGLTSAVVDGFLNKTVQEQMVRNHEINLQVKHIMTHMKIFGRLFLGTKSPLSDNLDSLCKSASESLFPWLSGTYPRFTTFNDKLEEVEVFPFGKESQTCFVKSLQVGSKGRGLVVTAVDSLVPELAGLLTIIRAQLNGSFAYPMEVFYDGDSLHNLDMRELVRVATEPMEPLDKKTFPRVPPPLKLTFVDIAGSIRPEYKHPFENYGMKILAYIFNSFEEMVMMDTDSVPLAAIDDFFELPQYRETSTLFYRDREINDAMTEEGIEVFRGILNGDMERSYLKLNKVDNKYNARFFKERFRHLMESGLFLINRKERFDGVISSAVMQLLKPFRDCVHGEKEYIWLGQEAMGREYKFNENFAVSVGELTTWKDGDEVHELCSTHPGHIKDDGSSVMWMNSGFLVCKKQNAYSNDERDPEKSIWDVKKEYESPLIVRNGLLPMGEGGGWMLASKCEQYMWCAHGKVDGAVLDFKDKEVEKWTNLGKAWVRRYHDTRRSNP
ncbi:DEKNAAC105402 [Brettanomyces naardenensis]|uniref:DEKNAAC105402 n=1 Tax=Brettanomyces naardenensis TaxID=13370 RepID=A0A448YTK0_BRENA|nr:DEKNAAC105402 [Brettanomyces naardenensis]